MRIRAGGLSVAVAVALLGCGQESFAERDPNGYEACGEFAANEASGEPARELGGNFAVAEKARKSSTETIREAASENLLDEPGADGENFALLDVEKFKAACSDAGFEFD